MIVVGGNDVTHRVRTPVACATSRPRQPLRGGGTGVVVGTCPDLGALPPCRSRCAPSAPRLPPARRGAARRDHRLGGHAVSLADVVGPFFVTQPDEMFALDRFHPSGAGYRRTAKAMLPSVLAALGDESELPFGHYPPAP